MCALALMCSCKDDSGSAGGSVLEQSDQIWVQADTFPIHSAMVRCDSIVSMPDSFLLGEMESGYGNLRAEILTQFACPTGFTYPEGATIDSVCLCLCYRTWFGDGNSPIGIDAFEISKGEFDYATPYPTNISATDYVEEGAKSVLAHDKILVAATMTDSIYSSSLQKYLPLVRAKMSDEFVERFFAMQRFTDQESFNKAFRGLYITPSFGSATVLNVLDINIAVYYSFSYEKFGRDTTVHDVKAFYANSEVRQVNCIHYTNQEAAFKAMEADSGQYNYIVSPANIYTRLEFPMKRIQDTINASMEGKRPYVNLAKVKVRVCNYSASAKVPEDWSQPAKEMLLIKESSLNRFFSKRELPSDTCALLAELTKGIDVSGETEYYYTYDLSALLTRQLRYMDNPDMLTMLMVPVDIVTTTTSNTTVITSIKQQQTISATQTYSAQNPTNRMEMEVVYSGF